MKKLIGLLLAVMLVACTARVEEQKLSNFNKEQLEKEITASMTETNKCMTEQIKTMTEYIRVLSLLQHVYMYDQSAGSPKMQEAMKALFEDQDYKKVDDLLKETAEEAATAYRERDTSQDL